MTLPDPMSGAEASLRSVGNERPSKQGHPAEPGCGAGSLLCGLCVRRQRRAVRGARVRHLGGDKLGDGWRGDQAHLRKALTIHTKDGSFFSAVTAKRSPAHIEMLPRIFLAILLACGGLGTAPGADFEWVDETVYRVTITTSFDIPKEEDAAKIRIIHALPMENEWSKGENGSAARNIKTTPDDGRVKKDRESGGTYIEWEERIPANGGQFEFSTTYETTSAKRWPAAEGLKKARWKRRTIERVEGAHPEIAEKAKELIKEDSPLEAFKKFSQWLNKRITYDASVPNNGVDDTMSNGAGHCGHRASVMLQFAKLLGIESRPSGGSSLRKPDGGIGGALFSLRPTWSNTHAWIELNFPGLGWVEAEPTGEDSMFEIPRHYVKTRGITQNYKAELLKGGTWERTTWEPKGDGAGFFSPVGERNVITFAVLDEKDGGDGRLHDAHAENQVAVEDADSSEGGADMETIRIGGGVGPEQVAGMLTAKTTFQLKRDGFPVGEVTVPKGSEVEIIEKMGARLLVRMGMTEAKWLDGSDVEIAP